MSDFGEPDTPERRGVARIELSSEPVNLRGEPRHEIWWRGTQWAVTEYGIERLGGTHVIEAGRLLESPKYPWPIHMAGKSWCDLEEFTTAWMVAILLHGHGRKIHRQASPRKMIRQLPPIRTRR